MLFSCTPYEKDSEKPSESLDTTVYRTVTYYVNIDGERTVAYTEAVPDGACATAPTALVLPQLAPDLSIFSWDNAPKGPVTEDVSVTGRITYTLPIYEETVNPDSGRGENDIRVVVMSDTHYFWPVNEETGESYSIWGIVNTGPAGFTYEERAQAMVDAVLAEWESEEGFDVLVINGDLANNDPVFKNPLNSYPDGTPVLDKNGNSVSFDYINTLMRFAEDYLSQLWEAGIPVYVTYGGHDYVDDETWYDIFGCEKNAVLKIGDTAFVLCDTFDYEAHSPGEDYQSQSDLHADFVAGVTAYLESDAITDAYIVAHYLIDRPYFNRLTDHPRITAMFTGHTHDTAVGFYRGKAMLQTGHFYFGGCFNTNNGNGMKFPVPLTEEEFAVNVAVNGIGYYELKDLVKTAEGLTVNGKAVLVEGSPAFLQVGDETYYHFGQTSDGTKVYKLLSGDRFYCTDSTGALTRLDGFGFAGLVNDVSLLFTDVVLGMEIDGSGTESLGVYEENGRLYRICKDVSNMELYAEKDGVFYEVEALSLVFTPAFECFVLNSTTATVGQYGRGYLGVTGNPWSFRVYETVTADGVRSSESYIVYPAEEYAASTIQGATYGAYRQPYLRMRPSDIPGLFDRSYWKK